MSWFQNGSTSSERILAWQGLLLVFGLASATRASAAPVRQPRLRVAAAEFGVLAEDRYTKYRPPFAKPAGDVLALRAIEVLRRFAEESNHR